MHILTLEYTHTYYGHTNPGHTNPGQFSYLNQVINSPQVTLRGKQNVTPSLRLRADGAVLVEFCISVCGAYKVHVRGAERG